MIDILQRIVDRGVRVRNGPTKAMLIQMQDLIPVDFEVARISSKSDIVAEMLQKLRQYAATEADSNSDVAPEDIPEGWGDVEEIQEVLGPTPLLRFRRREYSNLPKEEILGLLLNEQEMVRQKKRDQDAPTLAYARKKPSTNGKKTTPLPPEVSDKVVWFLYETQLKKVIQQISNSQKNPPGPPLKKKKFLVTTWRNLSTISEGVKIIANNRQYAGKQSEICTKSLVCVFLC